MYNFDTIKVMLENYDIDLLKNIDNSKTYLSLLLDDINNDEETDALIKDDFLKYIKENYKEEYKKYLLKIKKNKYNI